MPNTDPYALVADYAAVFPREEAEDDDELLEQLKLATRYLERECGRVWWLDDAATARVYVVRHTSAVLPVDEFGAVPTEVAIDADLDGVYEEVVAGADYSCARDGDLNAASGPDPKAYNEIHLLPWGDRTQFVEGERVRVTVKHGAPAIPADVRGAAIQLAAIWRLESPRSTGTVDEFGQAMTMSSEAGSIVARVVTRLRPRASAV